MNIQSFAEGGTGGQGFGAGRSGGIGGLANATHPPLLRTGAPISDQTSPSAWAMAATDLAARLAAMAAIPMPTNGFTVFQQWPAPRLPANPTVATAAGSAGGAGGHSWERLHQCLLLAHRHLLTASNAYGGNGGLVTAGYTQTRRQRPGLLQRYHSSGSAAAGVRSTGGAGSNSDGATNAGTAASASLGSVYATSASGNVDVSGEVIGGFGGIAFGSGNAATADLSPPATPSMATRSQLQIFDSNFPPRRQWWHFQQRICWQRR